MLTVAAMMMTGCHHSGGAHHDDAPEKAGHADEIILSPQQAEAAGLALEIVTRSDFLNVIKVSGRIMSPPDEEQTVAATANGIVTFTGAAILDGASVRSGHPLATISARELQDGDPVQKAKIAYEAAEKAYRRSEALAVDQIISEKEFEQVRMQYETAKAAYLGHSSKVSSSGINVTAPISGFVKNRLVNQGEYVSVGDPLLIITRNRKLHLRAEVPENRFNCLSSIRTAHFKPAYDGVTYRLDDLNGRLLSYGKVSDQNTFFLPVIFEFDNIGDFVAGAYTEVFLLSRPIKNVISIPVDALTEEQGIYYVYVQVKDEADAFLKREVTTGMNNGVRVEITKGLEPGELLVVKGAYQVKLAATSSTIPEGHTH